MLSAFEANRIYNDTILAEKLLDKLSQKIAAAAQSSMNGLALYWTVFNDDCEVPNNVKCKIIATLLEFGYDVRQIGENVSLLAANAITISWKDAALKQL